MPVKPKNDPLAGRLARMRASLGLNQTQMGRRFGVTRSTFAAWEEFGPPSRGPARILVLIMLERMKIAKSKARRREKEKASAQE